MLNYLKPFDINVDKVRLGPKTPGEHNHGDGGYVAPVNILEKSVALFSYGVSHDWRYEEDYYKTYNKPVYMFDHTVDHKEHPAEGLTFKKEGLGIKVDNCRDFIDHYYSLNIKGDVLLKIDAEGAEYDYFKDVKLSAMAAVTTGIIIEIHYIDNEDNRKKFIDMMEKLGEYYVVNHVHGNNWVGTFDYITKTEGTKFVGYKIPRVYELTLVNKRYVRIMTPDTRSYPLSGLDLPNNASPGVADAPLEFLNDI
jgi:hypothetical protein